MKTSTIARAVAVTALGAIAVWTLYNVRGVLLIVYISMLLAIGLGPVVRAIEHAFPSSIPRPPRWIAILGVYLTVVGALTIVGLLVVPPLVEQAQELWRRLPELLDRGQTFLLEYHLLSHRITLEEAVSRAPGPGDVAMAVSRVFGGLVAFVSTLILTFYLLVESEALFAAFVRLFPRPERPRVEAVAREISTKVSAWLSGQLILAGSIGLSAAVGLYLLGVPYFYVLALVAAIGEMIPVVGPVISAVPAIAVALSVSPKVALFAGAFMVAQQQIENHVLVPNIMERQVGVSAVTVIVALLIGGELLGIAGAILAVPSAAIFQVVVQELLDERDRRANDQLGPRFD